MLYTYINFNFFKAIYKIIHKNILSILFNISMILKNKTIYIYIYSDLLISIIFCNDILYSFFDDALKSTIS